MYFRLFLFILLGWLIIRMIRQFLAGSGRSKEDITNPGSKGKQVSKDVGEYVDYEELDE